MAQFSSLEQMTNVSKAVADQAKMDQYNSTVAQAISLIGKQIESANLETDADGKQLPPITGVVTGMKIIDGIPKILIGNTQVDLGTIYQVKVV
jgi:flagellar basal-body rod modification protein FlgD